jgi:hypothetical protein
MGLKYRISFSNPDLSRDFEVAISDVNYTGVTQDLVGSDRPFILKEFNTNEDFFKPIRAMMAEINIVTNLNGVSVDDFISDNDTDITVVFYASMPFGSIEVFNGILLQDDFQETWVDGNHILTLRAADRFGYLKKVQLGDNGQELRGKFTPLELIRYCIQETSLDQRYYYIFNNLYHESMSSASGTTPLMQCLIDAKTFQIETSQYDDCYTVLEKINKAFNQTLFAYRNRAFIMRLEELYTSYTNNLRGLLLYDPGIAAEIYPKSQRFEFLVGGNELVKPISPEMTRYIERKTKTDSIDFNYEQFVEIFPNQSFNRGTLVSTFPYQRTFTIDDWVAIEGPYATAVPVPPNTFMRIEELSVNGSLTENYVSFLQHPTLNRFAYSAEIDLLQNELVSFSMDVKFTTPFTGGAVRFVAWFQLQNGTDFYTMDNYGTWVQSNGSWTSNTRFISVYLDGQTNPVNSTDWTTVEVNSKLVPINGKLRILLFNGSDGTVGRVMKVRNLVFKYTDSSNSLFGQSIKGSRAIYSKNVDVKNDFSDTIFLDDGTTKLYKGSIFEMDGITLTDKSWYRYRYPTERYGFRQQNAIAHWEHNRKNRNKIDANFYGCFWNDGVNDEVISPINTLRFIDDDINRVYAILNIREMDFASNTWSATLTEVFNEITDVDTTAIFSATFNQSTYTIDVYIPEFKLPMTLITSGGFIINTGDTAKYTGVSSITTPISCSVAGFIKIANPQQSIITLTLRKNGTAIKTASLQVFSPNQPFSFSLSTDPILINTNDEFTVTTSPTISQIQILGGNIQINTPTSVQTFDNYQDKVIYK